LIDGLADPLVVLAEAGCHRVWLNGSFFTTKDEPGDYDTRSGIRVAFEMDVLDAVLLDLSDGRRVHKARFGGELFPDAIGTGTGLAFATD
jgi:hypothetical protein